MVAEEVLHIVKKIKISVLLVNLDEIQAQQKEKAKIEQIMSMSIRVLNGDGEKGLGTRAMQIFQRKGSTFLILVMQDIMTIKKVA